MVEPAYPLAIVITTIVSLLVAIALATGAGPLCWDVLVWAARKVTWPPPDAAASISGVALGLLFLLWRKPNWFLHTAVHELCHFIVCLLVLVRPTGISISDGKGGAVEHVQTDPIRSTLISIAPYTLPLLLLPFLITRHFYLTEPNTWRQVLSGLCAMLYVTHLQGLYHNVRINITGDQADLVKVGRPLSAVLIALVLLLITAWTLRALWTGASSGF